MLILMHNRKLKPLKIMLLLEPSGIKVLRALYRIASVSVCDALPGSFGVSHTVLFLC